MPSFDPTDTAALVAKLAAMADDKTFQMATAETPLRYLSGRFPIAPALQPQQGETAWLVGYLMMYRRQVFRGQLVVAFTHIDTAKAVLAQDAWFQVRTYDLRNPWSYETAGGSGVRAGP